MAPKKQLLRFFFLGGGGGGGFKGRASARRQESMKGGREKIRVEERESENSTPQACT